VMADAMTAKAIKIFAVGFATAILGLGGLAFAAEEVSIFVPYFSGRDGLSTSVTTVLALQVWQTLRRSGADASGEDFGKGLVRSFAVPQPPKSHQTAEAMARQASVMAQLVLWGSVQNYGNGAIVQAFLSIPEYRPLANKYYADFRTKHEEEWVVRIAVHDGEAVFRVNLPRRRVAFEPIIIPREVIEKYSSPGSIALYDPNIPRRKIGSIGNTFVALEQRGDSALVRSDKVIGIVRLPEISKYRSEIVDFVGGLIRIFRGDWAGAIDSLALVIENPHAPTDLRIDSHLYRAMALSKIGRPGHEEINRAFRLNPYLDRIAAYAVMERLALFEHMTRTGASAGERRSVIAQARQLIDRHRKLFLEEDPWVKEIISGLQQIEAAHFR
jgi:hypothetical protein